MLAATPARSVNGSVCTAARRWIEEIGMRWSILLCLTMKRRSRLFGALLLALVAARMPPIATHAQADQRCFPETGFCIAGRIRSFWEHNGGLPVFGFPITPQQEQAIEGRPLQVQSFERNRLELHPENVP